MSAESANQVEFYLLGAIVLEPALFWQVADKVRAEDFEGVKHRKIWQGMEELAKAGEWDAALLADHVDMLGEVANLKANAPGTASVLGFAKRVARHAEHRRVTAAGQRIAKLEIDRVDDALPILAQAQSQQLAGVRHVADVMADWRTNITARWESKSELSGISTGFPGLDGMTGGFQKSDLIIVAARPSMGKTAFAGQIAMYASSCGLSTLFFTMEMSEDQLANRMVSAKSSVGLEALMQPKTIADEAWPRVSQAATEINGWPMHFDQTSAISSTKLAARARQVKAQSGLDLIVIDYLQLMEQRVPDNPTISLKEISGALKQLAKELQVPVVALSQLNRSVEQRADKRPMNSDLRDCGAIEQDADLIMFLYRDEYYNENSEHKGYAELLIRKQRNGRTGMVPLRTELQFCRFAHADSLPATMSQDSQQQRPFSKRFGTKGKTA